MPLESSIEKPRESSGIVQRQCRASRTEFPSNVTTATDTLRRKRRGTLHPLHALEIRCKLLTVMIWWLSLLELFTGVSVARQPARECHGDTRTSLNAVRVLRAGWVSRYRLV